MLNENPSVVSNHSSYTKIELSLSLITRIPEKNRSGNRGKYLPSAGGDVGWGWGVNSADAFVSVVWVHTVRP